MLKNDKKPKILVTWPLNPNRFEMYQNHFQIDLLDSSENRRQQVLDRIAEYDGMLNMTIAVSYTHLTLPTTSRV